MAEVIDVAVLLVAVVLVQGGRCSVSGKPMTVILRNAMRRRD